MADEIGTAVERFIDVLHRLEGDDEGAVAEMADLFSDDARLENAALDLAGEERNGREGARHFWSEYRRTFKEARSDFHQITLNERAAGLFWTTRGAGNNGQPVEYDGASLLIFDDAGRITRFRGYYDTRALDPGIESAMPEQAGDQQVM